MNLQPINITSFKGTAKSSENKTETTQPNTERTTTKVPGGIFRAMFGIEPKADYKIPSSMPQTKGQIGGISVTVAGGDITKIKADAYVVPEFTNCVSCGGVGGAIANNGAETGLNEYHKHIKENGEMQLGQALLTKSGGGKSKYLLHTVTVGAKADNSFQVVQDAVYNALHIAHQNDIKSVVIPAMGTGIIGYLTEQESAKAILSGVNRFANDGGKMDVCVVVYSQGQGYKDFSEVLTSKSYENAQPVVGSKRLDEEKFISEIAGIQKPAPQSDKTDEAKDTSTTQTPSASPSDEDVISELKKYRGPKSTRLFSDKDIKLLLQNCQHSLADDKPIPNYQAKILAVLKNPDEVDKISLYHTCKSFGVYNAIQDPLKSTIAKNPELFS